MYELIKISDSCMYFSCPSKIGLFLDGNDAYLIDSGNNKDAAKKALKVLDEMGLSLKAVLVTHSHADHIGGCNFLQEKTGCRIFARGIEASFTRFPILEPSYLYGANPPEELRHKFILASPSRPEEFQLPEGIEPFYLPGHSFDMTGYKMPDGTVFIGDVLSGSATLEKYPLAFMYDIGAQLETLSALESFEGKVFVPSHADICYDLSELIRINREAIYKNCDMILSLSKEFISIEDLLAGIFERLSAQMTFEQNALCASTLKAYITYLKGCGRLAYEIRDNKIKVCAL
jgi:glyoxylase-like metal-dependent hydrolase (beta-lactamase superfamily II)